MVVLTNIIPLPDEKVKAIKAWIVDPDNYHPTEYFSHTFGANSS